MVRKAAIVFLFLFVLSHGTEVDARKKGLKVFISVDMEGIAGVVHWDEVSPDKPDYAMFRKFMTEETNAAIDGALQAGATEILVRDSHGPARNLLPEELREEATLLREWTGGPLGMMEGIDKTFDAAILVGYHGRVGTPNAPLAHTMSSRRIFGMQLDGITMSESGLSAAIAGYHGVPVVLVAGDKEACEQTREMLGQVEMAPVKEGIGIAAKSLHPKRARELIKKKTTAALKRLKSFKPYKPFASPHVLKITFTTPAYAQLSSWIPGAKREGERVVVFKHSDLMEIMKCLWITISLESS